MGKSKLAKSNYSKSSEINSSLELKMIRQGFFYDLINNTFDMYFFGVKILKLSSLLVEDAHSRGQLKDLLKTAKIHALNRYMEALEKGLDSLKND